MCHSYSMTAGKCTSDNGHYVNQAGLGRTGLTLMPVYGRWVDSVGSVWQRYRVVYRYSIPLSRAEAGDAYDGVAGFSSLSQAWKRSWRIPVRR